MEEAVHQLRQGLVQGVLTRHAVDGLLSATLTAMSSSCEAAGSRPVEHRRNRHAHPQSKAAKKPEMAWGWRVRRVVEDDEVVAAAAVGTGWSGTTDEAGGPVKNGSQIRLQQSPTDRAWEYFTAAQRAATGGGMVRHSNAIYIYMNWLFIV